MIDDEQGDGARATDGQCLADVAVSPHAQRQGIVPAVAEGDPEAVRAFCELSGDVVGAEQDAFFEMGPGGVKDVVGDGCAIDAGLAEPEAGDVEAGADDGF